VTGELPPTSLVRQYDTHRLIPSHYRDGGESVLTYIADDEAHLQSLFELDHATNDRLWAENGRALSIAPHELVVGVPHFRVINAAFTHPHPLGSRFNGPDRGAWYAAFELETSQAEIIFHKTTEYAEIDFFEDSVTYDDYLADFSASLHDLRPSLQDLASAERFAACLDPNSYVASQALAARLRSEGALGVIYPSVRYPGGTCLAALQPALVGNVRRAATYRFTWRGSPEPSVEPVQPGC